MTMRLLWILLSLSLLSSSVFADVVIQGFKMPESVAQDKDGNIYVSEIGERDVDKDGKITMIDKNGKLTTIVDDLYDPKGLVLFDNKLYVTDRDVVVEVDIENKTSAVYAGTMQFPRSPVFLNDIDVDDKGNLYVSDSGDFKSTGQIFIIKTSGEIETIFEDERNLVKAPNGLLLDGDTLYVLDWAGEFFEADLNKKSFKKIAEGFNGGDGIAKVKDTFFLSSWLEGKLYKLIAGKAELINDKFEAAADISLSQDNKKVYIPDMKAGTLTILDVN
jgi:gluconolactonase